ncbi:MAG: polyphosphate polymerase domain-containing protein [Bacteroidales bacterium]|nr:polyphosphate polymerase domain-containing protein [Bacteroidales bacterium]
MFFPPFSEEKSRFERKFLVADMHYADIEQQVRVHPAAFSPIFHPRTINNIYFDSNEFDFFHDNVSGKGSRKKARIRWYNNLLGNIEKPVLEFKIREGMLGNKRSFPLKPFALDTHLTTKKLQAVFYASGLPDWALEVLLQLKPALLNCYRRKYFLSFDNKFRLTLDDQLTYYSIAGNNNTFVENYKSEDVIVELKYDKQNDDVAPAITNNLPFRLTKSSKYVNGVELLHPMFA